MDIIKNVRLLSLVIIFAFFNRNCNLAYASTPFGFIENKGQITNQLGMPNHAVHYLLTYGNLKIQLKQTGFSYEIFKYSKAVAPKSSLQKQLGLNYTGSIVDSFLYTIHSHRIDFEFEETNKDLKIVEYDAFADYLNYYTQGCGENGIQKVKHYKKIVYHNIYNGIDLEFLFDPKTENTFKYNFILHESADINNIKFAIKGAKQVKLVNNEIVILTSNGLVVEKIPYSFIIDRNTNKKIETNVVFKRFGNSFGFTLLDNRNIAKSILVIDPAPWVTYYGGSGDEYIEDIVTDKQQFIYACGFTNSLSHIATTGSYQQSFSANYDAFLVKKSNNGSLIWSTYYGGLGNDYGISLDLKGNKLLFSGVTSSDSNMATINSHQVSYGGGNSDVFLAEFNVNGIRNWSTYYGGNGDESWISQNWIIPMQGIYDNDTNVFLIASSTSTSSIATSGTHQQTMGSPIDAFLVKFNKVGTRLWATYYGGQLDCAAAGAEYGSSVSVDAIGNIYIAGYTMSRNNISTPLAHDVHLNPFCVSGCSSFGPCSSSGGKGLLVKLNPNGIRIWGTYFGSNQEILKIKLDHHANIYLAGNTSNTISKFDSSGKYITGFWNGSNGKLFDLDIDSNGDVLVSGQVLSTNRQIGTSGAPQPFPAGHYDGYVVKLNKNLIKIWGTYFGGVDFDLIKNVKFNSNNNYVFAGRTISQGLATQGAHQDSLNGGSDGFISFYNDSLRLLTINNVIGGNQYFCLGQKLDTITGSYPLPNDTSFNYVWLYSNSGLQHTFTPVVQSSNPHKKDLILDSLAQSVWVKRVVLGYGILDTSNALFIQIAQGPRANFIVNDSIQCYSTNNFVFTNQSISHTSVFQSFWQFTNSPNDTSSLTNANKSFNQPGTFLVKLIVTDSNGCIDSIEKVMRVSSMPSSNFSVNNIAQPLHQNLFTFQNLSSIPSPDSVVSIIWHFGDNSFSNQTPLASKTYLTANIFKVKLIVQTNAGCLDSISKFINVYTISPITNNQIDSSQQVIIGNAPKLFNGYWPSGGFYTLNEDFNHANLNDSAWLPFGWQSNLSNPFLGGQNSYLRLNSNSGQMISYNNPSGRYELLSPPMIPTSIGDSLRFDVAASSSVKIATHPPYHPPIYYNDSLIIWAKVNNQFIKVKSWVTSAHIDTINGITTSTPHDFYFPPMVASAWTTKTLLLPVNTQQIKFEIVKTSINGISLDRILIDTFNAYQFLWQQSDSSANGLFVNAYGENNKQNYQPYIATVPTWYRRIVSTKNGILDTSNVIGVTPIFNGSIFYNKPGQDLNLLSTWGNNRNGSGSSPSSFNNSNSAYIAHNSFPAQINGNLVISGSNTFIVLGNPMQPATLTVPSGSLLSADSIILRSGFSGIINGSIITNKLNNELFTNITYSGTNSQSIVGSNYFNLSLSGASKLITGDVFVKNQLTLNAQVQSNGYKFVLGENKTYPGSLLYHSGFISGEFKRFFQSSTNTGNVTGMFPLAHSNGKVRQLLFEFTQAPQNAGFISASFLSSPPTGQVNTYDSTIFWQVLNLNRLTNNGCWQVRTDHLTGGKFNLSAALDSLPNMINYTTLRIVKRADTSFQNWVVPGISQTPWGSNNFPIIRVFNVLDANGQFTLASDSIYNVLPVKLISFNANLLTQSSVMVFWQTAQERNSSHFNLYRSYNAKDWEFVKKIKAAGNSNQISSYQLTDSDLYLSDINNAAYYRLEIVDFDGSIEHSSIALVKLELNDEGILLYPNPFNEEIYIECSSETTLNVRIYDKSGRLVLSDNFNSNKALINSTNLLAKGMYFVYVNSKVFKVVKY